MARWAVWWLPPAAPWLPRAAGELSQEVKDWAFHCPLNSDGRACSLTPALGDSPDPELVALLLTFHLQAGLPCRVSLGRRRYHITSTGTHEASIFVSELTRRSAPMGRAQAPHLGQVQCQQGSRRLCPLTSHGCAPHDVVSGSSGTIHQNKRLMSRPVVCEVANGAVFHCVHFECPEQQSSQKEENSEESGTGDSSTAGQQLVEPHALRAPSGSSLPSSPGSNSRSPNRQQQ
ncbi:BTB/POZ domain-containing protein 9 [Tupaia chinensis]|uniref:BTB/POZ domain-containing protein 9 n=1 Tax=Tupaia chinensis TaxID=246437 RepID=L9KT54_TUPCH|nr:BTB/POZ domain-containing protein 9 [Tupaia chinensis]